MTPRATVRCHDCDLAETFETLQSARTRTESHGAETGHDPYWELGALSPGVEPQAWVTPSPSTAT